MENTYKVIVHDAAQDDLDSIWVYLAMELKEPTVAAHTLLKMEETILSLHNFPNRHEYIRDNLLRQRGLRYVPVDNYLIIYAVLESEKSVSVLRVLHGKRNWTHLL